MDLKPAEIMGAYLAAMGSFSALDTSIPNNNVSLFPYVMFSHPPAKESVPGMKDGEALTLLQLQQALSNITPSWRDLADMSYGPDWSVPLDARVFLDFLFPRTGEPAPDDPGDLLGGITQQVRQNLAHGEDTEDKQRTLTEGTAKYDQWFLKEDPFTAAHALEALQEIFPAHE